MSVAVLFDFSKASAFFSASNAQSSRLLADSYSNLAVSVAATFLGLSNDDTIARAKAAGYVGVGGGGGG